MSSVQEATRVAVVEVTPAEYRALRDLLAERSVGEAARRDWVSAETVKYHRSNLYRKLGLPALPANRRRFGKREQALEVLASTHVVVRDRRGGRRS